MSGKKNPAARALPVIVVCAVLGTAALAALALLLGVAVDGYLAGGAGVSAAWVAAALVALLVAGAAAVVAPRLVARATGGQEADDRRAVLLKYFALGQGYTGARAGGELVSLATDAVEKRARFRAGFSAPALAAVLAPILVVLVIGVFIDPVSALLLAIALPVIPVLVTGFQKLFRSSSANYRRSQGMLAASFMDALNGLGMLRLNNAEGAAGAKIAAASERVRRQVMKLLAGNQLVLLVIDATFALGLVTGSVVLAGWRLGGGHISPGQGVAMVLLSTLMLQPVAFVGGFFYIGMTGRAAEKEITGLLELDPDVAPDVAPEAAPVAGTARGIVGGLAVENLSAGYGGRTVLHEVSLQFPAGSHTAVIGPSGSGKTTLARVLQGQLVPAAGAVLDGSGNKVGPLRLRAASAVLDQGAGLLGGSVAYNLRVGGPHATDAELRAVLGRVGLEALGLETPVGENGHGLSGGQAQRLGLARALLAARPVLVIDEPTSDLDPDNEARVLETLASATGDKTTITITHRLGLLSGCDRVAVLEHGRVIEAGPLETVLAAGGYLAAALAAARAGTDSIPRGEA
ncbi:ATP-binding cassette domain-containing protein [Paeniglutamicibacter kerguelensis]|uniref:ATP-binding cassette subfamily C protein CydD n=1 Tax=Paeniglutamicibacter kerguelensis TaxID=254788 RepID=A0ABS4XG28_9MICC|nr:ATP-binding cassette subfamily C protein CydD [Paeniglutamicibacter kerguelensis]